MCEELDVSPSGFYAWHNRPPSVRKMANQELCQKIKTVYNSSYGVCGSQGI